jgi:hypothetical protein
MIKDNNGKTPAFVVRDNTLLHQPTGVRVEINAQTGDLDAAIKIAMQNLKEKLRCRKLQNTQNPASSNFS